MLVIRLDIKVDTTVRLVGKAIVQYLLHQLLLLNDVTSGMGLNAGTLHVQRIHGSMVAVGVVLGYLHGFQLFQTGLLGNLILTFVCIVLQVTHISDITHVPYLIT